MLEAVVLAGGESTRIGSVKAVLPSPDGRSFIARIIDTLLEAGLPRVLVVTGTHHDAIAAACASHLAHGSVACLRNPDPSRGQLSSLLVGLEHAVEPRTEALLMTLVDVPMVTSS